MTDTTTPSTEVKPDLAAAVYYTPDGGPFSYAEVVARQPERTEAEWQRYERLELNAGCRS